MLEVDKWFQQYVNNTKVIYLFRFEISRHQCIEDYDEIEKLSTWYEFF